MTSINTGLYDQRRTGRDTMGRRAYNFSITMFTAVYILVATLGSSFTYELEFTNTWLYLGFLLVCMAVSIGGAFLAHSNDDVTTSIVGGVVCAVAMGAMIGPFVALFETGSVIQAFFISTGIVVLTGLIGVIVPKDLKAWGTPLLGALIGLIIIQLALPLAANVFGFDYSLTLTIIDYAAIALFSLIMVYDLNRAQHIDATMNNAVDVAVNVFLNFANIFIRVLALMGQRK